MKPDTLDEKLEKRVKEELTPIDIDSRYDDMLEECYSFDSVGGIFSGMSPARVLKEMDPVAYRCGLNDYVDGLICDGEISDEIDGEYYDAREVEEIKQEIEDSEEAA